MTNQVWFPQTVDLLVDDTHQHPSVTLSQDKPVTLPQSIDPFPGPIHQHSSASFYQKKEIVVSETTYLFAGVSHQHSATAISEKKPSMTPHMENGGWATFDILHSFGPSSGGNDVPSDMLPSENGDFKEKVNAFAANQNTQWFSIKGAADGPAIVVADQWHASSSKVKQHPGPQASEFWNAFDDFAPGNTSQSLFQSIPSKREVLVSLQKLHLSGDNVSQKTPVDITNWFQMTTASDALSGFNFMFDSAAGSCFASALLPVKETFVQYRKTSNPFDLPFDTEIEANSQYVFKIQLTLKEMLQWLRTDMGLLIRLFWTRVFCKELYRVHNPNGILNSLLEPWLGPSAVNAYGLLCRQG